MVGLMTWQSQRPVSKPLTSERVPEPWVVSVFAAMLEHFLLHMFPETTIKVVCKPKIADWLSRKVVP